jgi:hypothetical protein
MHGKKDGFENVMFDHMVGGISILRKQQFNPLAPELLFLIFAHPVLEM